MQTHLSLAMCAVFALATTGCSDAPRNAPNNAGDMGGNGGSGGVDGGTPMGGLFGNCTKDSGCVADCSPPANDPIATGSADIDLYDGCILAACQVAGLTETWMARMLKAQAMNESGITPTITTNDGMCGGQNCGPWAISAGASSGDSAPGPCGSSTTDPITGTVDYSHSYGLFQSTPACEGTFLTP